MVSTRGSRREGELSGSRKRRREDNPTRQTSLLQKPGQRQSAAQRARDEYWKDLLYPTWIFCSHYDFHVAKDRSWFADDYVPVKRQYTTGQGAVGWGMGMGTVVLTVRRSPDEDGPSSHGLLVLKDVVHAPKAPCNVIGRPITDDYRVTINYAPAEVGDSGIITDHQGRQVAYFKPERDTKFPQLCLSEPPVGPRVCGTNPLERLELMDVSFREHDEWDELQDSLKPGDVLTGAEKKFLLEEYASVDQLFEIYGKDPNISKEREEAFRLMRLALDDELHIAAYGEPPRHWRHPAAGYFTHVELDRMIHRSQGLQLFFQGHQLDPFRERDRTIARVLVRHDQYEHGPASWVDSPEIPTLMKDWAERVGKDFMRRRYGVRPEILWKSEDSDN